MALYKLTGRRRCSSVSRKLLVNVLPFQLSAYISFFVTNVDLCNELNCSGVYRSVNYIGSLAKSAREPM